MRKKAPLTVERKHSQGGFASEQTPHPSSCPPLAADRRRPFRCSSFSHTNRFARFAWEPCPFANPLKRPRRGLRPPSLDFPRSLIRTEIIQNAVQMRICQTGVVVEILCVCFGCTLRGSPLVRDMHGRPCKKDGLSTSIRQIFNGRKRSDLYGVSCAWETRFYGRPKGVPCGTYHR